MHKMHEIQKYMNNWGRHWLLDKPNWSASTDFAPRPPLSEDFDSSHSTRPRA